MSATPLHVLSRPFAIEPLTRVMLPDGIFDNAIYNLMIACHYTNQSGQTLTNVRIYLESISDPGIVPVAKTHLFPSIPAGATVIVEWRANFMNATPGKPLVSFMAIADGFQSRRSIQRIFVSQTRFDAATNSYTCTIEEGSLKVSNLSAIVPAREWWKCDPKRPRCPPPSLGPNVITGATLVWTPNPAYSGLHGELPFNDPWWKVVFIVIAIVAALVAIIAAALGAGQANFQVGGGFEETDPSVTCCTAGEATDAEWTVAGVASIIASLAIAGALSDEADPFWRGQAATPPADGELTTAERVVAKWQLPEAPNAGVPFTADVEWTYERFTTGQNYSHSVSETQTNVHVAGDVEVETPATVPMFEQLWVRSKFQHLGGGSYFKGQDLYAFAILRSPGPNGLNFVVTLSDDGLGFDPGPNDAVYAGALDLKHAYRLLVSEGKDPRGLWRVYVFAQDVNLAKPGQPPEIMAQTIGGMMVASAVEINFDPSLPCPLTAQATVNVV